MTIPVWDASTGVEMLPPLRGHDDYVLSVAFSSDGLEIVSLEGEWFTNIGTGSYLGKLPVGSSFYGHQVHGSLYVGWTVDHKPVIIHFPVQ
jgi:WD40 repeat protein